MPTGHVFIATSLDGFVARLDHQIDWLMKQNTDGEDVGYEEFQGGIDGIVMGQGSFENVLTFGEWPYQKPVIVMSKSLGKGDIPSHLVSKVRITSLDPPDLMASLGSEGWSRVYVDGGKVVQSFIRVGMIEDMCVTAIPILIGTGLRLFGDIEEDIDLELLGSKSFASGLVQSTYRVLGNDRRSEKSDVQ